VQSLSRHKHPRLWVSLAALPRNAQGKVSRREAARAVLETYELIDGRYPQIQIRTQP
jgi:acyl-coenzyme A synthetase/AMP-(fatty) acid ligase